jgi:hypothetical protein
MPGLQLCRWQKSFACSALKLAVAITLGMPCPAFAAALDEPIKPIPATLDQVPARAAIGRQLFNDVRLSANDSLSKSKLNMIDRIIFVWLFRIFPSIGSAISIVEPETIVRRHSSWLPPVFALEVSHLPW